MRRPAVRLLLTLAFSACFVGSVPATTEAGIIPWAYDTVFGPVGSIHARHAGYYGGGYSANYGGCSTGCSTGYCGPAPRLFGGLRAWRMGYAGYGGYAMGGCNTCGVSSCGVSSCGVSSCGVSSCGASCGGCSSCGVGGCGIDGGYGMQGYGGQSYGGGCASGQCGVNYPPPLTQNNSGATATSPVTPAPPPVTTDKSAPVQNDVPAPMGRSGVNDGYQESAAPGAGEGFRPRGTTPAPTGGDPTTDAFVPPRINTPANTPAPATDASPNNSNPGAAADAATDPATPPVPTKPKTKPKFGDDDEKGTSVGPRFELNEKVTWRREVIRTRQAPTAVRVSATVNRVALFPKMAWRTTADAELAKK